MSDEVAKLFKKAFGGDGVTVLKFTEKKEEVKQGEDKGGTGQGEP